MSSKKYFFSGLMSYVIWGFVPIFLKKLQGFDDYEIIFYRILLAALAMTGVALLLWGETSQAIGGLYRRSKKDFLHMLILTSIGGGLLATNWVTYVYVVNHVSINAASFSYLILPIATAFLALILLKEKLNAMRWAAVAMSGVSCYLMANVDARQMAYIAAITLSYSYYLITQRKNTYMPRRTNLALQMIVGTALLLTMDPIHTAPVDLPMHFWINVTIIAIVFTVTPLLLNLYALNGMGSSQLAFLIYINPIISFVTAIVWYGEDLNELAVISYSLLAVAILLFNWEIIVKAAEKTGLRAATKTITAE